MAGLDVAFGEAIEDVGLRFFLSKKEEACDDY